MKDESLSRNQEDVLFVSSTQCRQNLPIIRNNVNFINGANSRNGSTFRSQCNDIELSRTGIVTVAFNTSCFSVFTIFVINNNTTDITGRIQISPDGCHFADDPGTTIVIEPDDVGVFVGKILSRYTAVVLTGPPYGHCRIFLQGQVD